VSDAIGALPGVEQPVLLQYICPFRSTIQLAAARTVPPTVALSLSSRRRPPPLKDRFSAGHRDGRTRPQGVYAMPVQSRKIDLRRNSYATVD
jgi:hypothetical protein